MPSKTKRETKQTASAASGQAGSEQTGGHANRTDMTQNELHNTARRVWQLRGGMYDVVKRVGAASGETDGGRRGLSGLRPQDPGALVSTRAPIQPRTSRVLSVTLPGPDKPAQQCHRRLCRSAKPDQLKRRELSHGVGSGKAAITSK